MGGGGGTHLQSLLALLLSAVLLTLAPLSLSSGDLVPDRKDSYGEEGPRIFDITHRITSELNYALNEDGHLGQFLWLKHSMKNGSLANFSEMKLPTHIGTHVDAPGHFYDNYFDAGFDVDTLDLDVLNGQFIPTHRILKSLMFDLIVCCLFFSFCDVCF